MWSPSSQLNDCSRTETINSHRNTASSSNAPANAAYLRMQTPDGSHRQQVLSRSIRQPGDGMSPQGNRSHRTSAQDAQQFLALGIIGLGWPTQYMLPPQPLIRAAFELSCFLFPVPCSLFPVFLSPLLPRSPVPPASPPAVVRASRPHFHVPSFPWSLGPCLSAILPA